jgi:hypothetical protein
MRNFWWCLLLCSSLIKAQVVENFTDGNFSVDPVWVGDTAKWTVINGQLRSNSTIAKDTFYVSTPSTLATRAQWEWYVNLKFATSGSNYTDVYLTCDSANLKSANRAGYFVRIGNTKDEICLYKRIGDKNIKIIDGADGQTNTSNNTIKIKVTRDANNLWKLKRDITGTGLNYIKEGTVIDSSITGSAYFGISVKQSTTSFFKKHFYGNIHVGTIVIDTITPTIISTTIISPTQLDVLYTEYVDKITSETITNYILNDSSGSPPTAARDSENPALVHLTFATAFADNFLNTLSISGVEDFNDNAIVKINIPFTYYVPELPDKAPFIVSQPAEENDLVINELLANPKDGGVDFVEIYNRSNKIIDLNTIYISSYDTINKVPLKKELITAVSRLIYPKEYIVISENGTVVKNQYSTDNPTGFMDVQKFPSMNIASGTACLSTLTTVIDYFKYDEGMQFALLNDTKGVSLERIDFDRSAQDKTNWHSAAKTVGFATPAYENSQYYEAVDVEDHVKLSPELFSPDEDGINDVLTIGYRFDNSGYVGNISIYDSGGRLIKRLVRNELLGTSGNYSWDGIDENNEKARIGIYVVYFEAFDLAGEVKHYKKPCVVAGK